MGAERDLTYTWLSTQDLQNTRRAGRRVPGPPKSRLATSLIGVARKRSAAPSVVSMTQQPLRRDRRRHARRAVARTVRGAQAEGGRRPHVGVPGPSRSVRRSTPKNRSRYVGAIAVERGARGHDLELGTVRRLDRVGRRGCARSSRPRRPGCPGRGAARRPPASARRPGRSPSQSRVARKIGCSVSRISITLSIE